MPVRTQKRPLKPENAVVSVFLSLAMLFLITTGMLLGMLEARKTNGENIILTGTITDITHHNNSTVTTYTFTHMGTICNRHTRSYSSSWYVGMPVDIIYHYGDTTLVQEAQIVPLVFGILGSVFLAVSIGIVLVFRRKRMEREDLLLYGETVCARIAEVKQNKALRVNGRSPYVIFCTYDDPHDGTTYTYKSENLWENPSPALANSNTDALTVYRDQYEKGKRYVVDVAFLAAPQEA
ncbi:hypothetical protein LJC07_06280 [Christensenellaceae bacterium OttesenSCG-928-L17]|nr:hypothetical protein [Christensenellaceae bacterium OttesenSCG-928-L17]